MALQQTYTVWTVQFPGITNVQPWSSEWVKQSEIIVGYMTHWKHLSF